MSDATEHVLKHLKLLGFDVRAGSLAPFDEELPLVTGAAWHAGTAQLALLAEWDADDSDDVWRQLLFAASGLRHQLAGDSPAAFGPPIVLAIVDDEGERRLRDLAEDLSKRYALFNRIDLNLVRDNALEDDDALDLALAPLLPKCRALRGEGISRAEVQRFWDVLRAEVHQAALALDDLFAPYREAAGQDGAEALIGDATQAPELPAPAPAEAVVLRNFRSFEDQRIDLAPVTVLHGPNGGGKTSVVEALELLWAGWSQRVPDDVTPDEYARHLPRDGVGDFEVRSDDSKAAVADTPRVELRRSVLGQDTLGDLVGAAPGDRYTSLLTITGLEIPDLPGHTEAFVASTKRDADAALSAAGLPPLPRRDTVGLKHLRKQLEAGFTSRLPPIENLVALEGAVADASQNTFKGRAWGDDDASEALIQADASIAGVLRGDGDSVAIAEVLDIARHAVEELSRRRHEAAAGVRALLDFVTRPRSRTEPTGGDRTSDAEALPVSVAVRWLSHGRAVADAAHRFRTDATDVADAWRAQLIDYADALDRAAEAVPRVDLERLVQAAPEPDDRHEVGRTVDEAALRRAGFAASPPDLSRVHAPLVELLRELDRQADVLAGLTTDLDQHPARTFSQHAPRVLRAVCRFELARTLRRAGPVARASEQLVEELLQGRLAPVLRELVAAMVRFEWYFKPLEVSEVGGAVVIGGLATPEADLDARLVLNAAERTVVGVAWFLALHLLQPASRRRVLVLDDPTGAFDMANQAGFVSTLRALVRLTHPEQIIVTTHDDTLAAVLAEELAPVDNWPSHVARVRCQRDGHDVSVAHLEWTEGSSRATGDESARLGLEGEATLFVQS